MSQSLPIGYENKLIWWPELGMGYHPQEPISYEGDYWDKYLEYDDTDMGCKLTEARVNLVKKHTTHYDLIDIGIGGGLFVSTIDCLGYDVNTKANQWLSSVNRFKDPYIGKVTAITCWDSLEHIPDPSALLNQVEDWVFASIPVFDDNGTYVTHSKHYRPGEHIWYWSHDGFINFMARHGFILRDCNDDETKLGRENIRSYAFQRV